MRSEHNTAQQITINQMSYEQEFEELDLEDEQTKVRLLGDAFTESLRYMGSFSQRSLKYFDETACPQQLVAKRMPPVQNMLISKTDFKQNVIKEYQRVKPGEMRQVVAITGGGKSTTFPAEIANYTGENGLILSPRSDLSYFNGAFLSEKFLKQNYPGIQAVQLRSDHVKHPAQGKVLYYDVASSFFMMLAIYPTLLQKLGIKFILFDESHELTGDYKLAELLASAGKFRDVKVMLVSATRGDVNMEQEADTSRRRIVPVAPDLMDLGNLSSLGSNSPLHHSRINNRVLIFCPDFQCINAAKEYYEERDIPVIIHTSASSSRGMTEIQQFYEDHRVSVTLTDRVLQTGFTLDIEDVYCCGYTTELTIDMTSRMIDLKKTPVTMAIRQQRGGRTGRINSGTFYFADIESTMPTDVLSDSSACYLFLWCHLYNLTTNLPEVRKFKEFFGPISHRKVMKLLHSHVHPILAHPYMDLTGNMCHGWERVFDHAMRKATYGASEYDKSAEITADWVYQNIYDQRFVSELESIRVPMSVPEEWAPFFYAVWKVTNTAGKRWPFEERFDRRSVLSVVPLERRSKKSVFRPKAPRDSSATLALDSGSIARTVIAGNRHIVSPIVEDERSIRVAPAVASLEREVSPPEPAQLATQKVLPEIPSSPRRPTVETVSLSGPPSHSRGSSLSKIRTVPGKAPVSEMRSPSSAPSLDDYRQVKASTLHVEKVFPYNTDSLGVYLSNTARKEIDVERVRDMAEFRVKIYDMNSDSRHRYMLSLIRCWNYAVAAVSQLSAKQDRPVFFRTFSGRQISKFESDLESFKSLLITFEKERFRFAVMRSSRHSERGKITVQTDSTLVADRLDYIRGCLYVLKVDTQRRGLYLRDADCVLGALHVFENNDRVDRPHGAQVIRFARKDDLVVMGNTAYPNVGLTQLVRQPVDGEDVYIITVSASDEYSVFSGIQIASYAGRWFHTAQGAVGMSSAPIVAKSDGRLVGLHVGGSLVFPEYKGMMAPLYEFLNTDSN